MAILNLEKGMDSVQYLLKTETNIKDYGLRTFTKQVKGKLLIALLSEMKIKIK